MVDGPSFMVHGRFPIVGYNFPDHKPLESFTTYLFYRESFLGRIIHTTNPTRQRNSVLKRMTTAIREYSSTPPKDDSAADLAAAIDAALKEIQDSVDQTAGAWEKRDYWLKADAFRRQWSWTEKYASSLKIFRQSGNRAELNNLIRDLREKLESLKTS